MVLAGEKHPPGPRLQVQRGCATQGQGTLPPTPVAAGILLLRLSPGHTSSLHPCQACHLHKPLPSVQTPHPTGAGSRVAIATHQQCS